LLGAVAGLWLVAVAVEGVARPLFGPLAPDWLRLLLSVAPSFLGGLSVPLCFVAVHPKPGVADVRRACIWSLAIVVLAEALERYLPRSTFDWLDLTASVVGIVAAGLIAWGLRRRTPTSSAAAP
jgi:hypothetical protein